MTISNKSYAKDKPSTASGHDDWQAESDLRTLIEASKIRKDKARMRAAMVKRDEQRGHLSSIRSMKT